MISVIVIVGSAFGQDGWAPAGPRTLVALSDVAIHPTDDRVWAVISDHGGVWVTTDAGNRWHDVLGPVAATGSADEQASSEVEARLGELGAEVDRPELPSIEDGELDVHEIEDAIAAVAEETSTAVDDVVDEVRAELEAGAWFLDHAAEPIRPRLWFDSGGALVVARADGLRFSDDLGTRWAVALDEPVTAWAELPGGSSVAGTPSGLLVSATGVGWTRLSVLEGTAVNDLVLHGALYACTSDGLWAAEPADLGVWRTLATGPVYAVAEGVIHATADAVWHAGEPSAVPGSRAIVRHGTRLLAASSAGLFASTDEGRSWTRIAGVAIADVEVHGDLALLASADGLLRSDPASVRSPVALPDWVPLRALVEASGARSGLAMGPAGRAAALLPELTVEGQVYQRVGDDWNADTWTIRDLDTFGQIQVRLTWSGARTVATDQPFDGDELLDDRELMVLDDEVLVDDGSASWLLASRVGRQGASYRAELAATVSRLYRQRQDLLLRGLPGPLVDRVERALQVAELDARLDALTEGAVSTWTDNWRGER